MSLDHASSQIGREYLFDMLRAPATDGGSNAISLLGLLGYPAELVADARKQLLR